MCLEARINAPVPAPVCRRGVGGRKQRGVSTLVVIAILLILSVLGVAIVQISGQASLATVREARSLQAFYAAESTVQWGMNQLFYNTAAPLTRAGVDTACASANGASQSFSAPGLSGCSATLSCSIATDAGNTTSFYTLRATAQCGSGAVQASRTVELGARMSDS